MPGVFLSYARNDAARVGTIATALRKLGLEIWYDQELKTGDKWSAEIEARLRSAAAVVVCWSPTAIASIWVNHEAVIANEARKIIPVTIEHSTPPGLFASVQSAPLNDWRGEFDHFGWLRLLENLQAVLGRTDIVPRSTALAAEQRSLELLKARDASHFHHEKQNRKRHRILSIDSGGLGVLSSIPFLKKIEECLASRSERPNEFRLSDYFDLVGGTSAGALIAALIAQGRTASEIEAVLRIEIPKWYGRASRFRLATAARFDARPLTNSLATLFGKQAIDSSELKTGLAICLRRADAGSNWIITNNPNDRYWTGRAGRVGNRDFKIGDLLRAAMASFGEFSPKEIELSGGNRALFVDGSMAGLANPALHLLMTATLPVYGLNWPTGPDTMHITSIGAGRLRLGGTDLASIIASNVDQTVLNTVMFCQALGRVIKGWKIDRQLGDMKETGVSRVGSELFEFVRYDVDLENERQLLQGGQVGSTSEDIMTILSTGVIEPHQIASVLAFAERCAKIQVDEADYPPVFDISLERQSFSTTVGHGSSGVKKGH